MALAPHTRGRARLERGRMPGDPFSDDEGVAVNRKAVFAAALILSVSPILAEPLKLADVIDLKAQKTPARDMLAAYDAAPEYREIIKLRFTDTYAGMSWVNVRAKANLFCEPDHVVLGGEFLVEMLRGQLKRNPEDASWPWQYVLVKSMTATFPCKGGNSRP